MCARIWNAPVENDATSRTGFAGQPCPEPVEGSCACASGAKKIRKPQAALTKVLVVFIGNVDSELARL
jgi:hypothetical protein